jgi:hypothetical protein
MLSRNDSSRFGTEEIVKTTLDSSMSPAVDLRQEFTTIQDDVERLIEIAAQLFSAIERQIHDIESDLRPALGEEIWMSERTIFKERLIQSAQHLDRSLQDITKHLGNGGPSSTSGVNSSLELVR